MVPYVKVGNDAPQYRFSTIGKGTIVKKYSINNCIAIKMSLYTYLTF